MLKYIFISNQNQSISSSRLYAISFCNETDHKNTAPDPALLSNFGTRCGPQVNKFDRSWTTYLGSIKWWKTRTWVCDATTSRKFKPSQIETISCKTVPLDWRPVQRVPRLHPNSSRDMLRQPHDPKRDMANKDHGWIMQYKWKFWFVSSFLPFNYNILM